MIPLATSFMKLAFDLKRLTWILTKLFGIWQTKHRPVELQEICHPLKGCNV